MENELSQFGEYLLNPGSENAKDHLAFPLFKKLFGNKFKKQSDAEGADIYIEGKLLVELKSDVYLKGFLPSASLCEEGADVRQLLALNQQVAGQIEKGDPVTAPRRAKELSGSEETGDGGLYPTGGDYAVNFPDSIITH